MNNTVHDKMHRFNEKLIEFKSQKETESHVIESENYNLLTFSKVLFTKRGIISRLGNICPIGKYFEI